MMEQDTAPAGGGRTRLPHSGAAKNTGESACLFHCHSRAFAESDRTQNPEMQVLRVVLDSGPGANAPSRNDEEERSVYND